MIEVALGIGTNIGDRINFLQDSIKLLIRHDIISDVSMSNIYESKALLPNDAPNSWDKDFLNLAIRGTTSLTPSSLLEKVKEVEQKIGRKNRGFWSPREIDIDILIYGTENIISEKLSIPHIAMLERFFVLMPLNDIWSDWTYPREGLFYGKSIKELLKNIGEKNIDCVVTNYKITI